jgi:hypothetical protein
MYRGNIDIDKIHKLLQQENTNISILTPILKFIGDQTKEIGENKNQAADLM